MGESFYTNYNELPRELPILPFHGSLLLPCGKIPLEIFKQEYLNLIFDALGKERLVGIVQSRQNSTEDPFQRLYNVGCVGRISSFRETDKQSLYITLHGVCRFRVSKELNKHNGYRRIEADYSPYKDDFKVEDVAFDRDRLLHAFEQYIDYYNLHVRRRLVEKLPNSILLLTLSMMLPFNSSEKQALLECQTTKERFDSLVAILEMGAVFSNVSPDRFS